MRATMAMRFKIIPTVFTLAAILVLLGLGFWQLQRLSWKEMLIDRLTTRSEAAPESIPAGPLDLDEWEFRRVTMTGHFLHDKELHLLNRSLNGNPGLHVLTPFRRTDVPNAQPVLVNRGWVPFQLKDKENRREGLTGGEVTIDGIVRFQRPITGLQKYYTLENEPDKNVWYSINLEQMDQQTGLDLANYYVVDGNLDVPGLYPVGRQWTLDIRNDHLQYALTWFCLAFALAVIGVVLARGKRGKGQDS